MQIRHNLVVPEKPFFRRGRCVAKAAYYHLGTANLRRKRIIGFFRDETVADRFGEVAGMALTVCCMQPCARASGAACATPSRFSLRRTTRRRWPISRSILLCEITRRLVSRTISRRRWRPAMPIWRTSFVELARERNIAVSDELLEARQRCRHRKRNSTSSLRQTLRHRPRDRKRRRCREPVGHRGRRSLRVRRYQRRRARGQASGDGRGDRSSGARPCDRGPCRDRRDLCFGRRRSTGARRPHHGEGCPQGRAARRRADRSGPAAPRARSSTRRCCSRRLPPAPCCGPGETVSAIKAAFRAEKAGALVRLAKDVGRVGEKAGTRGALDTLRIAEGPKDVARAARLAEAQGQQDPRDPESSRPRRAAAGRPARSICRYGYSVRLMALFGLLSSIKATTERADRVMAAIAKRRGACGKSAGGGRMRPAEAGSGRCTPRHGLRIGQLPVADVISQENGIAHAEFSQRRR